VKKEKEPKLYFEDVPPAVSGPSSNYSYKFVDMTEKSKKKYHRTGCEVKSERSYGTDCSNSTSRSTLVCALTSNDPPVLGYELPSIPAPAPDSMIDPMLLAADIHTCDIPNGTVPSMLEKQYMAQHMSSMAQRAIAQAMPSTQVQPPKHEYNQFPMTGPVFLSLYQSPYASQRISKSLAHYNSPYHPALQNPPGSSGSQSVPKPRAQYSPPYALGPLKRDDQHPKT
jgi:hypothetical protein